MSFPNRSKDYAAESLLTAQDIVAYRARLGRMPKLHAPRGALFCLERGLPHRLRWRIPVRKVGGMNADVYETTHTKSPVVILTSFGGGSPIVVGLAEELAAMGVRKMILLTMGGGLQLNLKHGDAVVCTRAIRDEGASYHYLPPEKYIEADSVLAERLTQSIQKRGVPCSSGTTWTTDAPYRETLAEVGQYQTEGVKVVEMESAGLFTIGSVRKVQTTSIVVVMDSLASLKWQVPERFDAVQRSLELSYAAALEVLSEP